MWFDYLIWWFRDISVLIGWACLLFHPSLFRMQAIDPRTRMVLFRMLNRGVFDEINGCISTGKEVTFNLQCISHHMSCYLPVLLHLRYSTSLLQLLIEEHTECIQNYIAIFYSSFCISVTKLTDSILTAAYDLSFSYVGKCIPCNKEGWQ